MMDGWNMTGWGWGWMSLFPVLIIVAVALAAWTVVNLSESRSGKADEDPALEVLRHRFAAGEIDEGEFNQRRASLERSGKTG